MYGLSSACLSQKMTAHSYDVVEGDVVVMDVKNFIDEDQTNVSLSDLIIESSLLTDTSHYTYNEDTKEVVTKGKDYLEVGQYSVTISNGSDTLKAQVYVNVNSK